MSLKAKLNKWIGVATGDRKQEAVGTVQEQTGGDPKSDREIDHAVKEVKTAHHDYGQRVPAQKVAHVDRAPTPRRVHRPKSSTR